MHAIKSINPAEEKVLRYEASCRGLIEGSELLLLRTRPNNFLVQELSKALESMKLNF